MNLMVFPNEDTYIHSYISEKLADLGFITI